jgi:hypothetical protein
MRETENTAPPIHPSRNKQCSEEKNRSPGYINAIVITKKESFRLQQGFCTLMHSSLIAKATVWDKLGNVSQIASRIRHHAASNHQIHFWNGIRSSLRRPSIQSSAARLRSLRHSYYYKGILRSLVFDQTRDKRWMLRRSRYPMSIKQKIIRPFQHSGSPIFPSRHSPNYHLPNSSIPIVAPSVSSCSIVLVKMLELNCR